MEKRKSIKSTGIYSVILLIVSFLWHTGWIERVYADSEVVLHADAPITVQNYSISTEASESAKAITAFNFEGLDPTVIGVVDEGDVTQLVPAITHTGTSIAPDTGVAQDFSNPVAYTVTAADASTQDYVASLIMNTSEFAGGNGESEDPYQISKLEHLNNVRKYLDKHYILMSDLDFSEDSDYEDIDNKTTWTTGEGWVPIGSSGSGFNGVFNGNGYAITGLMINREADSQGLFGVADRKSELKNGSLQFINIIGDSDVGGLVGYNNGLISSFSSGGSVAGIYSVGGLAGCNAGTISDSYSQSDLTASGNLCGGLVGMSSGIIENSYATGNVNGTAVTGGLIGGTLLHESIVNSSYACGNVNGTKAVGGLIGNVMFTTVNNCYAIGSVCLNNNSADNDSVGGLIGNIFEGKINNSYAAGSISGGLGLAGGLIGEVISSSAIKNSYYDLQTSGLNDTGKGIPATTEEMKTLGTFSGWDFESAWDIVNTETHISYPYLRANIPGAYPGYASINAITSFNLEGLDPMITGVVNEAARTIVLTVPYSTDLTRLVPTIVHTGASISPASGVGQDFTNPVTYTVTAANGSRREYEVTVQPGFAGGNGESDNPYQISKLEHLYFVRNHLDKHFVLINDLDFSKDSDYLNITNKSTWTTGEGWEAIGTYGSEFTGGFDGNGYAIKGLMINSAANYQGLFGYTGAGAKLKNGTLLDVDITGMSTDDGSTGVTGILGVGSLTGVNYGNISNFGSEGNVTAVNYSGGLVGCNAGTINNCYSQADVSSSNIVSGGLVGYSGGIIDSCYATGNVNSAQFAGGLTGVAAELTVNNSYATGNVHGATFAGGLIGAALGLTVNNSYAAGKVEGSSFLGGLIGKGSILLPLTINNSYYDSQSSALADTDKGIPKTTTEMKTSSTFTGWDFDSVWHIVNTEKYYSYPYLRNNPQEPVPGYAVKPNKHSSGGSTSTSVNNEMAATATTRIIDNKTITTLVVNAKRIEEKLQKEGANIIVTIPVINDADVVIVQIDGQTIMNMETKDAVLEIKTGRVSYTLPASQLNIDNVANLIGEQAELKDISVSLKISTPAPDTVKIIQDTANKNNYQVVVKPIEFEIACSSGNKTVNVSKFNGYVERTIAIPEGVDPGKITTGIVLNEDGTFSHVPTTILSIGGRFYARINSLTNSIYSVIWSPKTFKDVETHWAKGDVNDMGARLIITGVGNGEFEPERNVSRAEFAAIAVNALGLMRPGSGENVFADVTKDAWYYDAVSIAYEYGIIAGHDNGKFEPMGNVTREQAMAMVARAMRITELRVEFQEGEAEKVLVEFSDAVQVAEWARESIAACIKSGLVSGKSEKHIAPKVEMTRAEVAVVIRRLLQNSELI